MPCIEVMDESGEVLAKRRLPDRVAVIAQLHELIGRFLPQDAVADRRCATIRCR